MHLRYIKDNWGIYLARDGKETLIHNCISLDPSVELSGPASIEVKYIAFKQKKLRCAWCHTDVPEEVVDFAILADLHCWRYMHKKVKIVEALNGIKKN